MNEALEILFTASFWVAAIRIASPLIFATMGELICERAGVLNLGIEGIMVAGAFSGWFTVYMGGDLWTGVLVAALTGAMFGLLHGFPHRATGPVAACHRDRDHAACREPDLFHLPDPAAGGLLAAEDRAIPALRGAGSVGYPGARAGAVQPDAADLPRLFHRRCRRVRPLPDAVGVAVRAVGENPSAVEAQGISVTGVRIGAVMAGSALMAIGGAFLTMSAFNSFFFEMINGRGWIAIALVVFGSWRPGKALIGAILFAAFDAYQVRLQQITGGVIPYQIFLMMPYVLSIVALVVVARRATYPKALMMPYQKGER
jgi:ABC-type uncharacterized transport system permease subunit